MRPDAGSDLDNADAGNPDCYGVAVNTNVGIALVVLQAPGKFPVGFDPDPAPVERDITPRQSTSPLNKPNCTTFGHPPCTPKPAATSRRLQHGLPAKPYSSQKQMTDS